MHHRSRSRVWLLAAMLALVSPSALAQTPPADSGVPPTVTVTPVPPDTSGLVTPPIVVPATPPPATTPPATTPPPAATTPPPPPPPPPATTPPPPPPPPPVPDSQLPTPDSQPPPALPPPADDPDATPAPLPDPAGTEGVADPGWTQVGFVPTARPLRDGDMFAQILGYMGGFGIQYGINGDVDISGGLTFFTLELAAKYAFYHNDYMSIAALAEIAFPFYKSFWPMSDLGLEYMMFLGFGPLFSIWNDIAELDVGLMMIPALQWPAEECLDDQSTPADTTDRVCHTKPFDTDFVAMPYIYGSIGLAGFARLMFGFEHFAVAARDDFACPENSPADAAGVCRGPSGVVPPERSDGADLNIPALLLGFRFHGERFMADIMLHFPMSHEWWDIEAVEGMIFIPTVSFGYLW